MSIIIGSDHGGFILKNKIIEHLKFKGYSLSAETQKVYNLLNCALKGVLKEEEIKEYLLYPKQ